MYKNKFTVKNIFNGSHDEIFTSFKNYHTQKIKDITCKKKLRSADFLDPSV